MTDLQKIIARIVGVVLTLVGIIGFFTKGSLLVFGLNTLHNVVHLVTGLLALAAGFSLGGEWAGTYNKAFGSVYVIVGILGIAATDLMAGLLATNMADNILHLVLGFILFDVGFFGKYILKGMQQQQPM